MSRERLNDELLALFADRGFASLFITHSVAEAVYLSTRVVVMSPRPGHILGDVSVPFSYPRQPDMRYSEEFAKVAGEVSDLLRDVPRRPTR
jgi:NitT/TauT family transport system ATP-binding protein